MKPKNKDPNNDYVCFDCGIDFLTEEQIHSSLLDYVWKINRNSCKIERHKRKGKFRSYHESEIAAERYIRNGFKIKKTK